jgi:hypothetical protein
VTPKLLTCTLIGHAARDAAASTESPLELLDPGGNSPTPGFATWRPACTGLPGCVPWNPPV